MSLEEEFSMNKKTAYNPMLASSKRPSPEPFTPEDLQKFLSKFYLIKTKYGYVLGRNGGSKKRSAKSSNEKPNFNVIEWMNLPSFKGNIN